MHPGAGGVVEDAVVDTGPESLTGPTFSGARPATATCARMS